MTLDGFELVPPTAGIITGFRYEADVTIDGHHIVDGAWGGPGIPSQSWMAVQAVPEPSSLVLLLPRLALLASVVRRRRDRSGLRHGFRLITPSRPTR